jgi:hypothetical protein
MNTTTTKIAGEAMTDEQIAHLWDCSEREGETILDGYAREIRFARALLASKPAVPQGFDEWMANPYTKTLMKSNESDYVPKPTAPAQSCGDAEQADASQVESVVQYQSKLRNPILPECDVWLNISEEGAKRIRESYSDVYMVRELFERAALPRASEQADEAVTKDARDAARYRWLRQNCFDWAAPGDGDSFDHIELHFEHELLGRDDSTVDEAIDAEMAADRAKDSK